MIELQTVRRVTVYTASALEDSLLSHFTALGARGYTVTPCRGKGSHGVMSDPLTGSSHSRIELLVPPNVGEKILMYLEAEHLRHHAITACMEDVLVAKSWQSADAAG